MIDEATRRLLAAITAKLDELGIVHMVVGSFASTVYGEPRTTRDLDLVIDPSLSQLNAFLGALDPAIYYVDLDVARDALRRRSMFNVIEIASAWKLDLVIRRDRPFSVEELGRRTVQQVLGVAVATASAEDTVIAKLEWAKQGASDRQLEDVAGILRVRRVQLDAAYIERWVTELELQREWARARAAATSASHWIDTSSGRSVWVIHAQSVADWPTYVPWTSDGFGLLVATDRVIDARPLAIATLARGLACVDAWGPGAGEIEATFDDEIVGDGSVVETAGNVILTTSHRESLRAALEYLLDIMFAVADRAASCTEWVVFAFGELARDASSICSKGRGAEPRPRSSGRLRSV